PGCSSLCSVGTGSAPMCSRYSLTVICCSSCSRLGLSSCSAPPTSCGWRVAASRTCRSDGALMTKILIVDYGMANLRSVQKAFEKVGHAAEITSDPNRLPEADKLVLPGVGAFRDAIARLREADLASPILAHIRAGKPFFGICLGLQLLFTKSYEDGEYEGLNVFPGEVVRFPHAPGLKVPHMGWNQLRVARAAPALRDLPPEPSVYFTH